jgi:hypothetical protein
VPSLLLRADHRLAAGAPDPWCGGHFRIAEIDFRLSEQLIDLKGHTLVPPGELGGLQKQHEASSDVGPVR